MTYQFTLNLLEGDTQDTIEIMAAQFGLRLEFRTELDENRWSAYIDGNKDQIIRFAAELFDSNVEVETESFDRSFIEVAE